MKINPTLKKISKNYLISSLGSQAPRILSLLTLPIITKFVDETDFGVRGIILSYLAVFVGIRELGISIMFQDTFFKRKNSWKTLWQFYHGLILVWTPIYTILMLFFIYFILPEEATKYKWEIILLICGPSLLFSATNNLARKYLALSEQISRVTFYNSTQTFAVILTNLFTIAYLKLGFLGWFIGDAIGTTLLFFMVFRTVYFRLGIYPIFPLKLNLIKSTLKTGINFIPKNYSGFLYNNSDKIILDQMGVNTGSIGHYNLAGTFSRHFKPFSNSYFKSVRPTLYRLLSTRSEKEEKEAHHITLILQQFFLGICFISAIWIKEIMNFLVSRPYVEQAYPLALILLMSYAHRPLYMLVSLKLFSHDSSKHLWKITIIPGILNVILNLIFIPIYGVIAAPITTFISMMTQGTMGFLLGSYRKISQHKPYWLYWIPIFFLTLGAAYYLMDSSWIIKITATFFCSFYGLFLFIKNKNLVISTD